MKPAPLEYRRARTIDEALELLAAEEGSAKIYAGGQSLGPMLNLRLARPTTLIDIRHIPELHSVEGDQRSFSIGATSTHAEIEDGAIEDPTRGLMPFVARSIAYRAVRNRGTIGGSLAHADPAADWVCAMTAIGATILLRAGNNKARRVDADQFFISAFTTQLTLTELLVSIQISRFSAKARWGYKKICRKTGEFAKAIGISIQDPQLALHRVLAGSINGRPLLLPQTTDCLKHHGPVRAAGVVRDEIDAMLSQLEGAHRQQLAVAVRGSLLQLTGSEAA